MADRKQTPDILSEIMSGAPPSPAPTIIVEKDRPARKPARSSKSTSKSSPIKKVNTEIKWEYKLVSFQDHKGYRPRFVNGVEIKNWMNAPLIHEFLDQLAEEGWELVTASSGQRLYGLSDTYQLYFKRPRQ